MHRWLGQSRAEQLVRLQRFAAAMPRQRHHRGIAGRQRCNTDVLQRICDDAKTSPQALRELVGAVWLLADYNLGGEWFFLARPVRSLIGHLTAAGSGGASPGPSRPIDRQRGGRRFATH